MEAETKETSFEKQNVVIIKNNVKGANLRECMYHVFFINPFKNFLNKMAPATSLTLSLKFPSLSP